MGVALTELLVKKETSLEALHGKTLLVDSPMWLYQFLSSIRQKDGALLTDTNGHVTSHLVGLFSRLTNLLKHDLKVAFVFDGRPPELKKKVLEARKAIKQEAQRKYEKAAEKEDLELMKKYASMSTRLTKEMIVEAKDLVRAFGLPVIEAPAEAEAQAAHIIRNGDGYAIATNDADALLFGSPRIVRNLNMVGKRKKASRLAYDTVTPDIISLGDNLNHLGLDHEQLIALAMLVGTDYNPKGIKGLGPKKALKLVKEHKSDFAGLFAAVRWDESFDYPWETVYELFRKPAVSESYTLGWGSIDQKALAKLLVDRHDFSAERFNLQLKPLLKEEKTKSQTGLSQYF